MMEEKGIAEKIRSMSGQRPHRIVIDEKLPSGSYRILVSGMKSGAKETRKTDLSAWEEEEERLIGPRQLTELIPGTPMDQMVEGRVFVIEKGEPNDFSTPARNQLKEKTAKLLLVREGKTKRDMKEAW